MHGASSTEGFSTMLFSTENTQGCSNIPMAVRCAEDAKQMMITNLTLDGLDVSISGA
jgi:hypothetical protein